jgi:hypothetical protein
LLIGVVGGKCKKLVQIAMLFHTLKHGNPIFEYEVHKKKEKIEFGGESKNALD